MGTAEKPEHNVAWLEADQINIPFSEEKTGV
jgi:hypothetical protein